MRDSDRGGATMGESERLMILVPAAVTVLVVLMIENSYGIRGGIAPFVHQLLTDTWQFVTDTFRSLRG